MALIRVPRGWEIPERSATSEAVYTNRRRFMKALGLAGAGLLTGYTYGCADVASKVDMAVNPPDTPVYPAAHNPDYTVDRPVTEEPVAARFNNFYEFTTAKSEVYRLVDRFETRPWEVEVTGQVDNPRVYDVDDLARRMPLEERVYRFRCVEAWAMTVPWTGFPLKALIDEVKPKSSAKYIRLVTFMRPEQAPGQKQQTSYPWPYSEGLTMAEAMSDLTLLATGIYGHELPKQHGAPVRLVVPWKYGYKSIKSIVKIEFTDRQPATFWNTLGPKEYDFWANVNPDVPHPRWSQAYEHLLGPGDRVPTRVYNGYEEYVGHLYGG